MSAPRLDLYWPAGLAPEVALEAVAELNDAGVQAECRIQPVRRGAELAAVVLLTGSVMGPFLQALFAGLGGDAHTGLRRWVQRLCGTDQGPGAATAVVFENTATGAEFVFTPGLPDDAFRRAVVLDPGPERGRWVWDDAQGAWARFEAGRRPREGETVR